MERHKFLNSEENLDKRKESHHQAYYIAIVKAVVLTER